MSQRRLLKNRKKLMTENGMILKIGMGISSLIIQVNWITDHLFQAGIFILKKLEDH